MMVMPHLKKAGKRDARTDGKRIGGHPPHVDILSTVIKTNEQSKRGDGPEGHVVK